MKAIIYERVSSKGNKQDPKLQHKENIIFCEQNNLEILFTLEEKGSAYQLKTKRPVWEEVKELAIKNKANIVLWRYDRAFRNRQEFFKFMKVMFEVHGLKVYSVKEPSIISFYNLIQTTESDNPIFDNLLKGILQSLWDFQIQQAGEQAEEESRKKSDRVKMAVRKEQGKVTKSYKGNVWGRPSKINKKLKEEVLKLHDQGLSIREISQSVWFWDKNNNQKFISKSAVHKIIAERKQSLQGNIHRKKEVSFKG